MKPLLHRALLCLALGLLVPLAGCGQAGPASSRAHAPAHTRIGYTFKKDGRDRDLFIWSHLKLGQGSAAAFATITAVEGRNYVFEDGQSLSFSRGRVVLSGKSQGVLSGNFTLSGHELKKGFIRTFD